MCETWCEWFLRRDRGEHGGRVGVDIVPGGIDSGASIAIDVRVVCFCHLEILDVLAGRCVWWRAFGISCAEKACSFER